MPRDHRRVAMASQHGGCHGVHAIDEGLGDHRVAKGIKAEPGPVLAGQLVHESPALKNFRLVLGSNLGIVATVSRERGIREV